MYKEISIENFFGGLEDDPRTPSANGFNLSKHFDIYTFPKKLVPINSTTSDENDGTSATGMKSSLIRDFARMPYYNNNIVAMGNTSSSGYGTRVLHKTDILNPSWTPIANTTITPLKGGMTVIGANELGYFNSSGFLFRIAYDPNSTTTIQKDSNFNSSGLNGYIYSVARGVKAKDGNVYMPYNRSLARVNATPSVAPLSLAIGDVISSTCNYNSYLAVGVYSFYTGRSTVYLWDLVSTQPTETIDWGEGEIRVLENVGGTLVGITDEFMSTKYTNVAGNLTFTETFGIPSLTKGYGKMVVRQWAGGEETQIIKEIKALYPGGYVGTDKAIRGERLRFIASVPQSNAEKLEGVWSFGRKSGAYPAALSLEVIEEAVANDLVGLDAFYQYGNYDIISHSADGSINRTSTTAYSYTSRYVSQIFNDGDPSKDKQLASVTVTTEPLPDGASVTIKYRKDDETDYTTISTHVTEDALSKKSVEVESTGVNLPAFKEIQFEVQSVGGAVITGFKFKYEDLSSAD